MKTYSEKELLIFDGVLKLIAEGKDLADITSRQIARSAGIGKSTIYDYFTTKNDVINKAIIYAFENNIEKLINAVADADDFESKMKVVFRHYISGRANASFMLNTITAYGGIRQMIEEAKSAEMRDDIRRVVDTMDTLYKNLLALGRDSGVISLDFPREYVRQVMQSVLSGVSAPMPCACTDDVIDSRIKNAYSMLTKALN